MEIILMLHNNANAAPVILLDVETGKVEGLISSWDIMSSLTKQLFNKQALYDGFCAKNNYIE